MTKSFRPFGSRVRARFELVEIELLRSLASSLAETLDSPSEQDDVIRRLFPRAVDGDDEADGELRRLMHDDLFASRRQGLVALGEILERARLQRGRYVIDLEGDEPLLLLGTINDLRLALGARIGIAAIERDDLDPRSRTAHQVAVLDHLAWLQEQLLGIIEPSTADSDEG